ncbi:MAG: hypothetical protein M8866_09125 [marine benthic group bacterium]|jgi:hypothetical protein|nr:hypothetical protein [Candidatus Benthicola marisminoris]
MEVKVLIQGPDTVHPIVISVPEGEDPTGRFATAISQNAPVLTIGSSTFRTERVLAVTIQEPTMRTSW